MNIKVKKLHADAIIPKYQTLESAGFDLHAIENCEIAPLERKLIATGLAFEIQNGYEVQVRARSGLAIKNGIGVLNAPGTIDSDYRGEIKVILINFSNEIFRIQKGDRIAQGVVSKVWQAHFEQAQELSDTQRGAGGFGSSGLK